MTQRQLNVAVALATGESLAEIRCRGFGLTNPRDTDFDAESYDRPPQFVNWDELDAGRLSLFP